MVRSALTFASWPSSLLSPLPCEALMIGCSPARKHALRSAPPRFQPAPSAGDPSLNSPDGGRMVFRKHKGGPGAFEVHESIVSSRFVVPVFHQPRGCSAAT